MKNHTKLPQITIWWKIRAFFTQVFIVISFLLSKCYFHYYEEYFILKYFKPGILTDKYENSFEMAK